MNPKGLSRRAERRNGIPIGAPLSDPMSQGEKTNGNSPPSYVESMTMEEVGGLVAIGNATRALDKARARCLTVDAVLDRLAREPLVPYQERRLLFLPLQEAQIAPGQIERLKALIEEWIPLSEASGGRKGDRVYGLIRSTLEIMPRDYRVKSIEFLDHRHVHRRQIASGLLRSEDLNGPEATAVCLAAERRPDILTIQLASRHARMIHADDAIRVLLPRLEEPYWQARVIEAIVATTSEAALQIVASTYPMGFLWAAARLQRRDLFARVEDRLPDLERNLTWLPIIAWALGRLRLEVELDDLEARMRRHPLWSTYTELNLS